MTATLAPLPIFRAFTANGAPLAGGLLYTYAAGTTTPLATYTDQSGATPNANPVVLDANGQANVWLKSGLTYKINLTDASLVQQTGWPADGIVADAGAATLVALADAATLANGDALLAVQQPVTGAAARTQHQKNADFKSLTDFTGADPTGATNSDAALQAAINYGAFEVPDGTFVIGGVMTVNNNVIMRGAGKLKSIIKQKNAANCNLFNVNGDYTIEAYNMQFDGNAVNQTSVAGSTDGFAVPIGSIILDHCYLHHFKCNIIRTGNVENTFGYAFDINKYAHDLSITNCIFDQGATGLGYGDHIRLHKVTRGFISNNYMVGGLSPVRGDYYCSFITVSNNYITATGDVGVTLALCTDSTITGNVCTYNLHNGIEIDSVKRVTCVGNTCSNNTFRGIQVSTYAPPAPSGSTYNGYLDGVMLQYSMTAAINSASKSLNVTVSASTMKVGDQIWVASTNLGNVVSVTNGGVAPCVATMAAAAGATFTSQSMTGAVPVSVTDMVISGNNCNTNGYSGIMVAGVDRVLVSGNTLSGNNTANVGEGGIYLAGDVINLDSAQIIGNTFNNTGYQTVSIVRNNSQYRASTRVSGNQHIGGTTQTPTPILGMFNVMADKFLLSSASVSGTAPFAPDPNARLGAARQIAGGNTVNFIIPTAPPAGNCMVYLRLRTPNAAASPSYFVNLMNGVTFVYSIVNTAVQVLSSNPVWTEIAAYIPGTNITGTCATNQLTVSACPITLAAGMGIAGTGIAGGTTISSVTNGGIAPCVATLSSTPGTLTATSFMVIYDKINVGVIAAAGATHINVEEVSCFVPSE